MTRRRVAAAAVAALAGLLPLAACGIQGTDVVEAGGAATVLVAPNPEARMVLYFVGPDGRSMPVVRDVGFGDPEAPFPTGEPEGDHEDGDRAMSRLRDADDKVLAALLAGPNSTEAAAGLTTALPLGAGIPRIKQEKAGGAQSRLQLRLQVPFDVTGLSAEAVRQLVCTVAYARDRVGLVEVAVTGPDGTLPAATCADTP
ncbi:hypothetical protein ACWFR1_06615 [Streptomyces sp. NPDC055103]